MHKIFSVSTKSDLKLLKQLAELFVNYHAFYGQTIQSHIGRHYLQERLSHKDSLCFVASDGKDESLIKGFAHVYPIKNPLQGTTSWTLYDLFVAENFRNQGVGSALLKHVKQTAQQNNIVSVHLTTAQDNYTAQRQYQTQGYQLDDKHCYYTWYLTENTLPSASQNQAIEVRHLTEVELADYSATISQYFPQHDLPALLSRSLASNDVIYICLRDNRLAAIMQLNQTFCSLLLDKIWQINQLLLLDAHDEVSEALVTKLIEQAKQQNLKSINVISSPQAKVLNKVLETYGFSANEKDWQQYYLPLSEQKVHSFGAQQINTDEDEPSPTHSIAFSP